VTSIISRDGTTVAYTSIGTGPAVLVIPGALSVAADYLAFARELGSHFTVHVLERRGRGKSGPQAAGYNIGQECEDVLALRAATDARFLVGHSYGGLVALETAALSPVFAKVAVYEPGVSVNGSIRTDWMPAYERHLSEGRRGDAFVDFVVGSRSPEQRTAPRWLMKVILSLALRRPEREQMYALLEQNLREHREVARLDNDYVRYRSINAPVLLMSGGKDTAPSVARAIAALAEILPHPETARFPRLDHFGIQKKKGAAELAQAVATFLRRPVR
jgi:pimeloyl-ACP methyl ester carboxylesterase